jgi:hypothetical protein
MVSAVWTPSVSTTPPLPPRRARSLVESSFTIGGVRGPGARLERSGSGPPPLRSMCLIFALGLCPGVLDSLCCA